MNKPPYIITPVILNEVAACFGLIGKIQAFPAKTVSPGLRKQNRVKSIFGSLKIEGNSLDIDQMTALFNHQRIRGPKKDIQEVENAIRANDILDTWSIYKEKDFLSAHKMLMSNIIDTAGHYRSSQVGVFAGDRVAHVGPSYKLVPKLMQGIFDYLKNSRDENALIVGSVFHYEVEFIHPFQDGNGRMGRLWQSAILSDAFPVFRNIPVENAIRDNQEGYYKALAASDKQGSSTVFIEFMLVVIRKALEDFCGIFGSEKESAESRLQYAMEELKDKTFTRKDYKVLFVGMSTATASRDLKKGVDENRITKTGEKRLTRYKLLDIVR
jgi:cell filamentation protein, protein adenylyltransferase